MRSLHFALARKHTNRQIILWFFFLFLFHFAGVFSRFDGITNTDRYAVTPIGRTDISALRRHTHANHSCAYCVFGVAYRHTADGACTKHFLLLLDAVLSTIIIMINWWFSCSLQSMGCCNSQNVKQKRMEHYNRQSVPETVSECGRAFNGSGAEGERQRGRESQVKSGSVDRTTLNIESQ